MIGRIREAVRDWRKRRALRRIRSTMGSFGYDLSEVSDAEIIEATENFAELHVKLGVSAQEATEILTEFWRSVNAQTAAYDEISYLRQFREGQE